MWKKVPFQFVPRHYGVGWSGADVHPFLGGTPMKRIIDHTTPITDNEKVAKEARRALAQNRTVWAWTGTGYELCDGVRVKNGQLQAHLFDRWVEAEDFDVE